MPGPSGYIISAHGGRWSNTSKSLQVPGGSSVVYYVKDGEILSNATANMIIAALFNGKTPSIPPVEIVNEGGMTYPYECWYAHDFDFCGIYMVGSTKLVMSLKGYPGNPSLPLSKIFSMYPGETIHWLACREIVPFVPDTPLASASTQSAG